VAAAYGAPWLRSPELALGFEFAHPGQVSRPDGRRSPGCAAAGRTRCCRALTPFHRASPMIRSSGTSWTTQSSGGFGRAWRLPVMGSLIKVCRFQTSLPM